MKHRVITKSRYSLFTSKDEKPKLVVDIRAHGVLEVLRPHTEKRLKVVEDGSSIKIIKIK